MITPAASPQPRHQRLFAFELGAGDRQLTDSREIAQLIDAAAFRVPGKCPYRVICQCRITAGAQGPRELFDLGLAHELYGTLIGSVEGLIKGKRHLVVVPSGPLTALPFHLLVTKKPAVAVPQVKTPRDLAAYLRQALQRLAEHRAIGALSFPVRIGMSRSCHHLHRRTRIATFRTRHGLWSKFIKMAAPQPGCLQACFRRGQQRAG